MALEVSGGIALILGVLPRWIALVIAGEFIGIIVTLRCSLRTATFHINFSTRSSSGRPDGSQSRRACHLEPNVFGPTASETCLMFPAECYAIAL